MFGIVFIKKTLHKINTNLGLMALFTTVIFAIIYCFLDDNEFGGLAKISKHLKAVHQTITTHHLDNYRVVGPPKLNNIIESYSNEPDNEEKDISGKVQSEFSNNIGNILRTFCDRLYFAIVTGSTVGFGDIYPKSGTARILSSIHIIVMFGLLLKS
jgi:hypothetical protein